MTLQPCVPLLGGPIAGLNNAKDALFQLCRRGRKISYPTLRWNARVPNTPPLPSIAHEALWDVDYWNAYVSNHSGCGLPHMVRDRPTTLIKTPGFANSLWLNTFRSGTQTRQPAHVKNTSDTGLILISAQAAGVAPRSSLPPRAQTAPGDPRDRETGGAAEALRRGPSAARGRPERLRRFHA